MKPMRPRSSRSAALLVRAASTSRIAFSGAIASIATAIALIHCYYGYNARGGPVGVGVAVGKAIRTSIVVVLVLNFALSALMWGISDTVRIA